VIPAIRFCAVLAAVLVLACLGIAQTPAAWHYDLRPGDHLIYRYTFEKRTQDDDAQTQVDARFRTHVLVAGENAGQVVVGFQRNREAAELTEYRSKGKDRLAKERPEFQKRMQTRPSRFSEAQEISSTGEPRYYWEMARETPSHLLNAFHEIMGLPPLPLAKGEAWRDSTLLGLDLRWVEDESIHGKRCHHVEGSLRDGSLKFSYWWSPESGVMEQVGLDGYYSVFGSTVHETARMELESRSRGEDTETWLTSADTRQGALQAMLLGSAVPVSPEQISTVLASDDTTSQALAMAVASRRKLALPPAALEKLRQSSSVPVRLLAHQFSKGDDPPPFDDCHRPLPPKPAALKFGTSFESVPATKDSPEIPYLLRVPVTYRADRPAPLLVYLSGGAGFAIDGVNSADDIVSGTDYLVVYPQAAAYWWTPEVAARFDAVFHDIMRRYNVDPDRVYLTGFSNGGTGSLYFATLWPQRFAAVVSLMGAGQCTDQVKQGLTNLENIPLFFVHGETDPLISPDCSRTTHAALSDLRPPVKPELKILPDRGHDITLQSDNGLTLAFFKDKVRNPFPREIAASLPDALAARQYWVEFVDGKPGKSGLEARVKSDNTVEIHSHDVKHIRLHLRPELFPKKGDLRIEWNGKKMFQGPLADLCSAPDISPGTDPKLDLSDTRDLTLP
jgi:dienelactone hydrolase